MNVSTNLDEIERRAYRSSYSDGLFDVFAGLSLVAIGAIWIWAEDYGGLAGVLPAVLFPSLVPLRKQIVEARGGYVRWSSNRRRWERRNVLGAVAAGVLLLLLGVVAYLVAADSSPGGGLVYELGPGLLAFLLAIVAAVLGLMVVQRRRFAYALCLVAAGAVAVIREANPGWPLFGAGILVAGAGVVMLVRYLRSHPVVESQ